MNPPTEGVVTNAWPFVIASYGLLWASLVAYGGWFARSAAQTASPAQDRLASSAIVIGALWVVLGVGLSGYDYATGLALPKAVLYAWSLPGIVAVTYGIVRQQ